MDGINIADIEASIVEWIGKVRANPNAIIPHLEERLKSFNGKAYKKGDKWFNSREGDVAVKEALEYLKTLSPLSPLRTSESLAQAAKEHSEDMSKSGITGHAGSNGSTMAKRVEQYGKWKGGLSENLAYQQTTGLDFVLYWIIDDGVSSRADRNNIFKPEFGTFGVAVASHPKQKTCAVLLLSGDVAEGEKGKEATMLQTNYEKGDFNQFGTDGKMINFDHLKGELIKDIRGKADLEMIPGAVSVAEEESIVIEGGKEKRIIKMIYTMGDGSLQTVEKDISE